LTLSSSRAINFLSDQLTKEVAMGTDTATGTDTTRILITGALGQIGSELTMKLRERFGGENVIASDIKTEIKPEIRDSGPYEIVDVTDPRGLLAAVRKHEINTIYHMSAILSANGEQNPMLAWEVNINGTRNILDLVRDLGLRRVFVPSSIAVFGPETPRDNTPQETVLMPKTMYGITKVAGELLCDYYVKKYDVDARGVRYPGIISHKTLPGGGTTDYAVEIFYAAVKTGHYDCFVKEDTVLPMMYMPDCLKATLDLMDAEREGLRHHSSFNIAGMSFSAGELAAEIRKHISGFTCDFKPDSRQGIADTWPKTIDDGPAREEWGWAPDYDLSRMAGDMIANLSRRHAEGNLGY
jgi:nucleoside-diphosphate-sugar epimerase